MGQKQGVLWLLGTTAAVSALLPTMPAMAESSYPSQADLQRRGQECTALAAGAAQQLEQDQQTLKRMQENLRQKNESIERLAEAVPVELMRNLIKYTGASITEPLQNLQLSPILIPCQPNSFEPELKIPQQCSAWLNGAEQQRENNSKKLQAARQTVLETSQQLKTTVNSDAFPKEAAAMLTMVIDTARQATALSLSEPPKVCPPSTGNPLGAIQLDVLLAIARQNEQYEQ
jgi:flagellar motility protein MotE (MotC chaperone)